MRQHDRMSVISRAKELGVTDTYLLYKAFEMMKRDTNPNFSKVAKLLRVKKRELMYGFNFHTPKGEEDE